MIIIVSIIVFSLGLFLGLVVGYSALKWSLRQDGYFIKYDSSKEIGQGRYTVLQELDLDLWSKHDE